MDPTNFDHGGSDHESGLHFIEKLTTNPREIQRSVLEEILRKNSTTLYLNQFLHGNLDYNTFKQQLPIVNYDEIKPYIDRIADGETHNLICSEPISELLTSSGTSGGKPKIMPSTANDLDRKTLFYDLLAPVLNKYVSGLDEGKAMYLYFVKPEIKTRSGLTARPVLTSYYKSKNFKNRPFNKYNVITSSNETILCLDNKQSMYCQLLCGLRQRDQVLRVGAVFASAFLRGIKFLENNWPELCTNIRTGELSEWITDPGCRKSVTDVLGRPDPELADSIEAECGRNSWEGIVRRVWPKTKYVEVVITGSMAQYIPTLDFYSGGLPLASTMYESSECFFGINLKPLCKPSEVSYTLLPNMACFEFLPMSMNHHHHDQADQVIHEDHELHCSSITNQKHCSRDHEDDQKKISAVDLVDVKVGHYYELLVTTYTGLYRYRVGDILMVTGFHNSAPQFRFVHRRNVVLSIDTDKTNEDDLLSAVTNAKRLLQPLGCMLTEYTSYADASSIPGHYVLYWEINDSHKITYNNFISNCTAEQQDIDQPLSESSHYKKVMEECCWVVEEGLDTVYKRSRVRDKSIGPLEIRVVEQGCFDVLMDLCVSQGSSVNQYKTPRCVKADSPALKLLNSKVVANFFSTKTPTYVNPQIQ